MLTICVTVAASPSTAALTNATSRMNFKDRKPRAGVYVCVYCHGLDSWSQEFLPHQRDRVRFCHFTQKTFTPHMASRMLLTLSHTMGVVLTPMCFQCQTVLTLWKLYTRHSLLVDLSVCLHVHVLLHV